MDTFSLGETKSVSTKNQVFHNEYTTEKSLTGTLLQGQKINNKIILPGLTPKKVENHCSKNAEKQTKADSDLGQLSSSKFL